MTDDIQRFERANRLDIIIKSLKFNGKSFAKSIGMSQGTISNLLNGKRSITLDLVEKIAKRHSLVNPSWLLFGEGDMFISSKPATTASQDRSVMESNQPYKPSVLSANIVAIRHRWRMDQESFGSLIGGSRNQVSNWERGRTEPGFEELYRLEMRTGIPLHRLRSRELEKREIPEFPRHTAAPLDDPGVSLADVYALQKEILQRVAELESMLRALKEHSGAK